ncbi:hypothetical protein Ocin01_19740 [Orchesella cincta]|uniref:Protein sleepless n=1 Tax=Orchesella cincta TaxID=48709 RepID=A0A1D2M1Z4_ORCCI|nr:hypothetical protein Ocin01_19740 [Orchesella cincta]
MNSLKPLLLCLLCGILLFLPATAEEATTEKKEEVKAAEAEVTVAASGPTTSPAPSSSENNGTSEPDKKPVKGPSTTKPRVGRTCFVCANCPIPQYLEYCGGMSKFCFMNKFENSDEVLRGCAKPEQVKFSIERNQTCDEYTDGVSVCYCDVDLCNGVIFSQSALPKAELPVLLVAVGIFIFPFFH